MSTAAHQPGGAAGSRLRTPLIVAALAAALFGVFLLGRRSAGPRPGAVSPESAAPEAAVEKGVIRFEPESLKLADLTVEPVTVGPIQARLTANGIVEPDLGGVVKVTPRVAGKITAVLVNVGDNVRGGQALATIASTDLAQAQAAFRQARQRVTVAGETLRRQRRLAGLGEFGRHQVEEARTADVQAQGEVNTTLNELAAARNEVIEARSEKAEFEGEVASAQADAAAAPSEITEAQGLLQALQSALVQAQTQVKVTQSRFNRADTLLKEELVSKQDWEQAQADFQKAQSDVEAARANIAQGRAKIETARGHLKAAEAKVRAAQGRAAQAAAKIDSAVARQAQVESKLAAARKHAEISGQALTREEKVYTGGFFTTKEVVEAEAALWQAQAEQRAASENIRLLGGTPGGGNLLTVAAPTGGRLIDRTVTLGETVNPEKTLFTVVNLSSVWVQLNVYQRDLGAVRSGQPVTITSDAAPGRGFTGAVSYIGDLVDETTRTVKVRAVIQNAGGLLKPQTFVRGRISAAARTRALTVPKDAVQEAEGKQLVYVQGEQPGEFHAREVRTGETVEDRTVITSGLQPGDRVVTRGAFLVKAQAMKSELTEE